jgi:nucleotide-binding universal stress UspA family protein
MRSILIQAGRDPDQRQRLDSAVALAESLGGHVTVLVDTPLSGYVAVDPFGGTQVAQAALTEALAADDQLAAEITAQLQGSDVPFDVLQFEMEQVDALALAARLADLVVLSRSGGLAGDVALASRCPVLALPPGKALRLPVARAAIAWDDSAEAAYALRCAVPLLAHCGDVRVLTVQRGVTTEFPPTTALRYLARHGIEAELIELVAGTSVEETLAEAVRAQAADLLVMGAYGHGRLREFLFGGVTRYFLDEPSAPPLLLAH